MLLQSSELRSRVSVVGTLRVPSDPADTLCPDRNRPKPTETLASSATASSATEFRYGAK